MADVNDRGQLIVITGLVLATVFVALALVVNGAIYTENVASRDTGIESSHAQEDRLVVEEDLRTLIDRSNRQTESDDWSNVESTFMEGHEKWRSAQMVRHGITGRSFSSSVESVTEGTYARQVDESRNFTAGGSEAGKSDWTLAQDIREAGPFRLNVTRQSLLNVSDFDTLTEPVGTVSDNAFYVSIENDTAEWRVYLFRDGAGTVYLYTVAPGDDSLTEQFDSVENGLLDADEICLSNSGDDYASVDFRESRFADSDVCGALSFYDEEVLGANHSIHYRNARTSSTLNLIGESDRARGSYELVVDTRTDRTPFYAPESGDDPHATAIIHSAAISVDYRSSRLHYGSETLTGTWRVVP